jgi:hypothetical protein
MSVCIELTTLTADGFGGLVEHTCRPGRCLMERSAFMLKTRISHSEYIMNIFYIIGVIVVVLFVASFFGLHA